ncbi:hypothetical protein LINGRAHAP2_LOCUS29962 [Linum grandiflorum]
MTPDMVLAFEKRINF